MSAPDIDPEIRFEVWVQPYPGQMPGTFVREAGPYYSIESARQYLAEVSDQERNHTPATYHLVRATTTREVLP